MSGCLSEQYEKKVCPCIELIDSLRALGVENDTLPAIALIGDQSSGKCLVLEAAQRNAQNEIAGNGRGISEKLISLEVTSANFPDLTFIDLPGINNVAVKDQLENIDDQVKKLITSVITKQETIILVVVPCNLDISTSEALKIAREVDPNGERTLGILTKPDLVDNDTENTVVSILNNDIVYLNEGYMIVKCRGQQEIRDGVSPDESLKKEKDFNENRPHFRKPYAEGKANIPSLAKKLTLKLSVHTERSLPQLKEQIRIKLRETQSKLDCYRSELPTEPEQRIHFLIDKITAFTQDAMNLVIGEEAHCMPFSNIFPVLTEKVALWKKDLDNVGEKFDMRIKEELQGYEEKYRGREFPGFLNFRTFEVIMREQIKQLEEPAIRRLKEIADDIRKQFIQLAQCSFPNFPNLLKMAKTKIENINQVMVSEAKSMLRTQFKMELMIYSQDEMYLDSLCTLKIKAEGEERKNVGVARTPTTKLYDHSDSEGTLEELTCHLKSYYTIVATRLADQVPMVIRYMVLQESAAHLQSEMIQLIQERHNINKLLKEEHDMTSKRENLKAHYNRLMEANNYLSQF